jgi:hypothetical protein
MALVRIADSVLWHRQPPVNQCSIFLAPRHEGAEIFQMPDDTDHRTDGRATPQLPRLIFQPGGKRLKRFGGQDRDVLRALRDGKKALEILKGRIVVT